MQSTPAVMAPQVPAKLISMPLKQFGAHMQPSRLRRRLKNLYYEEEHYYWSGPPPEGLGHRPDKPPLSCLTQPSSKLKLDRLRHPLPPGYRLDKPPLSCLTLPSSELGVARSRHDVLIGEEMLAPGWTGSRSAAASLSLTLTSRKGVHMIPQPYEDLLLTIAALAACATAQLRGAFITSVCHWVVTPADMIEAATCSGTSHLHVNICCNHGSCSKDLVKHRWCQIC